MPSLFGFRHTDPYASQSAPSQQQQHKRSRSAGGMNYVVPLGVAHSDPPRPQSSMGHHPSSNTHRARVAGPYAYEHGERERSAHHRAYTSASYRDDQREWEREREREQSLRGKDRERGRGRSGSLHALGHAHLHGRPGADYVPVNIAASAASSGSFEPSTKERRAQSLRRTTWHPAPLSSMQTAVKIHRALACTKETPALLYDVVFAPSHDNILSAPKSTSASFASSITSVFRSSRKHAQLAMPLPAHTLALAATRPLVSSLTLFIPCLPSNWEVRAVSMSGTTDPAYTALTNLDVLHAVYAALRAPVSRREWNDLGNGSSAQKRVAEAYKRRCEKLGSARGEREAGVRRSDFLCGRTALWGIECRSDGRYELVFGKPAV